MREKGVRHDVVDAVFALGGEDDLVRLLARVEALQSFLGTEAGKNLLTAYRPRRQHRSRRGEEGQDARRQDRGAPDAALLEQAEEKAVAAALARRRASRRSRRCKREDFAGAMAAFAGLRAPIDAFFDKVTVNVADKPDLRLNRLKLAQPDTRHHGCGGGFLQDRGLTTMAKWVYSFGDGKAEGRADMRNLLGGKGANLAEMSEPRPAGAAGLHHHHRGLHLLLRQRQRPIRPS